MSSDQCPVSEEFLLVERRPLEHLSKFARRQRARPTLHKPVKRPLSCEIVRQAAIRIR